MTEAELTHKLEEIILQAMDDGISAEDINKSLNYVRYIANDGEEDLCL